MAEILQGTTPIVRITLPDEIDYNDISVFELTVRSGTTLIKKHLSDITYQSDANRIVYQFLESETLSFEPDGIVEIQARFKITTGDVYGTRIKKILCRDLISEDVI